MSERVIFYYKDPRLRRVIYEFLKEQNYDVSIVESLEEMLDIHRYNSNSVILSELEGDDKKCIDVMREIHRKSPDVIFIFISKNTGVNIAVKAMKEGAYYYITEPVDLGELKVVLEHAFNDIKLRMENIALKDRAYGRFDNMIGKSEAMLRIYEVIQQVAPTDTSILITGETGVGKELVAESIHLNSRRRDHPLVKLHCATLSEGVLESELFGHEKGAFTDAVRRHIGRFERADGGTLFIDEISEISPSVQVKLLRVLEYGTFERVGGDETITVDVRLITATNKDLKRAVEDGRFRDDLYWRIKVIEIYIPSLRERREDIPLLIDYYLELFSKKNQIPIKEIDSKARELLVSYNWPGNIRELKNVIENIVVLSKGNVITVNDLPKEVRFGVSRGGPLMIPVGSSIEDVEKALIRDTLFNVRGDKKRASEILGISLGQLERKIKRYRL
ncbi:MAG: sigma-54-dependent transcriptional regulator [bacterium]